MIFLHRPISLFLIIQQFISIAWSQNASSTAPSTTVASVTTTAFGTVGNANSTGLTTSASTTASALFPMLSGVSSCGKSYFLFWSNLVGSLFFVAVSDCLQQGPSDLGCSSEVDVNCFCFRCVLSIHRLHNNKVLTWHFLNLALFTQPYFTIACHRLVLINCQ